MISFKLFLENQKRLQLEHFTIVINKSDEIERNFKKVLKDDYKFADNIVRWYRNDKREGKSNSYLKDVYKNNLNDLINKLNEYSNCIDKIKKAGKSSLKVNVKTRKGNKSFGIEDLNKFGYLDVAEDFIRQIIDSSLKYSSVETGNSKYRIKHDDAKKIYILDFTKNVVCWVTEGPGRETTNKLVYQLWKDVPDINAKMDSGSSYGNYKNFSPYCTNSEEHWNEYEHNAFPKENHIYQQFWYFKKLPDIEYVKGDLTNKKVQEIFLKMSGRGPEDLIAMNDSIGDLRDTSDADTKYRYLDFGSEIKQLEKKNFKVVNNAKIQVISFSNNVDVKEEALNKTYPIRIFLKGQVPEEYKNQTKENVDVHNLPQIFKGNIKIENDEGYKKYLKSASQLKIINGDFSCVKCNIKNLKGLPEKVNGDFKCSHCESLESLEGVPREIGGNFKCISCKSLKSFKGVPEKINGSFICSDCDSLESLEGAPREVKNDFNLLFCKKIDSLEGMPEKIGRDFKCTYCNSLKSLKGCTKEIGRNFICDYCDSLISFDGMPKEIKNTFNCSYCGKLTSFKGMPEKVGGNFNCSHNYFLKSLKDIPEEINGNFDCSYCNLLTSLEGAPRKIKENFICSYCEKLKSLKGGPEKVNGNFDCSRCNSLESLEGAPKLVGKDFDCVQCYNLKSLKNAPRKVGRNFDCSHCDSLNNFNIECDINGKFIHD